MPKLEFWKGLGSDYFILSRNQRELGLSETARKTEHFKFYCYRTYNFTLIFLGEFECQRVAYQCKFECQRDNFLFTLIFLGELGEFECQRVAYQCEFECQRVVF